MNVFQASLKYTPDPFVGGDTAEFYVSSLDAGFFLLTSIPRRLTQRW